MPWILALVIVVYFLYEEFVASDSTTGKLGYTDLVTLAQNAGFQGVDAYIAAAVAMAESGGDPNAVGDLDITAGGSVGLWQINLHFHPEYNADSLTDPAYNAQAAFEIYTSRGNSFRDWSTFKGGQYAEFLPPDDGGQSGG